MKEKDARKVFAKLIKAEKDVMLFRTHIKTAIKDRVDFDFFIDNQPSGGIAMVHKDNLNLSPLSWVLFHLDEHERLSETEFESMCI
jgi:hypothetical protein